MAEYTTILAIWGAVVSTAVAAWNFYKDYIKRETVFVNAGFRQLVGDGSPEDVFVFFVKNRTSHRLRITHCGGYSSKYYKSKIMQKIFGLPKSGFLFSFAPYQGPALPLAVDAMDGVSIMYQINKTNFPEIKDLSVTTSDGRTWFCPRKDIQQIVDNEIYKEIGKVRARQQRLEGQNI